MKKILLITFSGAILALTACSSIDARSGGTQSGLYPGVKQSKENYDTHESAGVAGVLALPYAILDLPSCIAVDTVLLPLDLIKSLDYFKDKDDKVAPKP
jgi:uncharacterized protein YceK